MYAMCLQFGMRLQETPRERGEGKRQREWLGEGERERDGETE